MDQIRIGAFIAQRRKEKGLTQRQLADALDISDKTVSKWERGKGLPEVALMLPLCECLSISVNELLSGQLLTDASYLIKAEENMMRLMQENRENRKKLILAMVVVGATILSGVALILVSGLIPMKAAARITLIAIAAVVIAAGIGVACILDRDAGEFECPECGAHFVPTMKAYIMGPHTLRRRLLTCPNCGKRGYCQKRV